MAEKTAMNMGPRPQGGPGGGRPKPPEGFGPGGHGGRPKPPDGFGPGGPGGPGGPEGPKIGGRRGPGGPWGHRGPQMESQTLTKEEKHKTLRRTFKLLGKFKKELITIALVTLLTSLLGMVEPYISSKIFYDEVLANKLGPLYGQVAFVVCLIVGTSIAMMLTNSLAKALLAKTSGKLVYGLKRTIFESVRRLSLKFFTSNETGGLMAQVDSDATSISTFLNSGFTDLFTNLIQIIIAIVLMVTSSVPLSIAILVPMPLYAVLIVKLIRNLRWMNARSWSRFRAMNGVLSDSLTGVRVIKAFGKENDETKRFSTYSQRYSEISKEKTIYTNTRIPIISITFVLSSCIVWAIGGVLVIKGDISYGVLSLFLAYFGILERPMFSFAETSDRMTDCMNAMNRLFRIEDSKADVDIEHSTVRMPEMKGDVNFTNVNFTYDGERMVLKDVSFDVKAGDMLGIVGHSGAGKSTIANLLIRLYDVTDGSISVDGVNIKDINIDDLRRNVAIVSQETYLFMGTIYENIAYSKPNATRDEVIRAARIAGAHDFIMKTRDGYETKIGFGHKDLSGGEKQRISIARAILKDPKILILDEATASMDTLTERKIQAALSLLSQGRTTIMIAHRLSTLRDCSKLISVENGEVVETGTHIELIERKGAYYKLYKMQLDAMKNIGVEQ